MYIDVEYRVPGIHSVSGVCHFTLEGGYTMTITITVTINDIEPPMVEFGGESRKRRKSECTMEIKLELRTEISVGEAKDT